MIIRGDRVKNLGTIRYCVEMLSMMRFSSSPALNYWDYNKSYDNFNNRPKIINRTRHMKKKGMTVSNTTTNQRTIANEITLKLCGLAYRGKTVNIEICSPPENFGLCFKAL